MYINYIGNVVLLVRVAPYGKAEELFMGDFKQLKKDLKITEAAVQLHELFEWKTPTGEAYTQYELDFGSESDLEKAFDYLRDYFYKMTITYDAFDNEMHPEVVLARKK